ncbi:MAG: hypothetical protein IPP10_15620 [Candidatus Competibacteraceae bacterium]|nr:hypothetical protein [Candidatus Competibacteraceae bacterium]
MTRLERNHQRAAAIVARIERNMEISRLCRARTGYFTKQELQALIASFQTKPTKEYSNYVAVEFKPLYVPFDYSFAPAKEYVPQNPYTELQICVLNIENALLTNSCTSQTVQELTSLLKQQAPFERPETIEDAENLLADLRGRAPELFE